MSEMSEYFIDEHHSIWFFKFGIV